MLSFGNHCLRYSETTQKVLLFGILLLKALIKYLAIITIIIQHIKQKSVHTTCINFCIYYILSFRLTVIGSLVVCILHIYIFAKCHLIIVKWTSTTVLIRKIAMHFSNNVLIYIIYVVVYHTVRSEVKVHQTFNTAFYKILNAIGDICERTCCKMLFYVANKFL